MKKLILLSISLVILFSSCSKDASTTTPTPSNLGCSATTNGFTCKIDGTDFVADSANYGWYPFNGARMRMGVYKGGREQFAFYILDTVVGTKTYPIKLTAARGEVDGYYSFGTTDLRPYQSDSFTITMNSDKTVCGTFKTTAKNAVSSASNTITVGSFKGVSMKQ
jgi:hypothetical protein